MLESIILMLAIFCSTAAVFTEVDNQVRRDFTNKGDLLFLITSCIFWGIFYYLTKT